MKLTPEQKAQADAAWEAKQQAEQQNNQPIELTAPTAPILTPEQKAQADAAWEAKQRAEQQNKQSTEQPFVSQYEDIPGAISSFGSGMSLGFRDELSSMISPLLPYSMGGSRPGETYDEARQRILQEERDRQSQFAANNPKTDLAMSALGTIPLTAATMGMANPILGGAALSPLNPLRWGAKALETAGKAAPVTTQTAIGGLYGYGNTERTGTGAAVDVATGAAGGFVGAKGGELVGWGLQKPTTERALTALNSKMVNYKTELFKQRAKLMAQKKDVFKNDPLGPISINTQLKSLDEKLIQAEGDMASRAIDAMVPPIVPPNISPVGKLIRGGKDIITGKGVPIVNATNISMLGSAIGKQAELPDQTVQEITDLINNPSAEMSAAQQNYSNKLAGMSEQQQMEQILNQIPIVGIAGITGKVGKSIFGKVFEKLFGKKGSKDVAAKLQTAEEKYINKFAKDNPLKVERAKAAAQEEANQLANRASEFQAKSAAAGQNLSRAKKLKPATPPLDLGPAGFDATFKANAMSRKDFGKYFPEEAKKLAAEEIRLMKKAAAFKDKAKRGLQDKAAAQSIIKHNRTGFQRQKAQYLKDKAAGKDAKYTDRERRMFE